MGKALIGATAAITAGVSGLAAVGLMSASLMLNKPQEEPEFSGFTEAPDPVMFSTEFPPEEFSEEKMAELYGPLNKEALNESKEGIIRNMFANLRNRIHYRKQSSCNYSRAVSPQQSRVSYPSCQPSSPSSRPCVGPSSQPTPHSPPVILNESDDPSPIFIEVL